MKLSNFKIVSTTKGIIFDTLYATVDVTTGWWIFKTIKSKDIVADVVDGTSYLWKFVDTGIFTPGYQAEQLHKEFSTKKETSVS